jgi:hypothetical protein
VTQPGTEAEQLHRVHDLVRGGLGDDLLGLALYGSVVTSGLRPSSDLDLFGGHGSTDGRRSDAAPGRRPPAHLRVGRDRRADLNEAPEAWNDLLPDTRAFAAFVEREIRSTSAI